VSKTKTGIVHVGFGMRRGVVLRHTVDSKVRVWVCTPTRTISTFDPKSLVTVSLEGGGILAIIVSNTPLQGWSIFAHFCSRGDT